MTSTLGPVGSVPFRLFPLLALVAFVLFPALTTHAEDDRPQAGAVPTAPASSSPGTFPSPGGIG